MKYNPRKAAGYFFRIIGALSIGFGILCFLGGPDAKFGSIDSLKWGSGYFLGGFVLIGIGKSFYKNIK